MQELDIINDISQERICRDLWFQIAKEHKIPEVSRKRKYVIYRHAFFVAARKHSTLSLATIGKILNKDHATVLHGIKNHEMNYRYDRYYHNIYNVIEAKISELLLPHNITGEDVYFEDLHKNKAIRERLIKLASQNRRLIQENEKLKEENEIVRAYASQVNKENSALKTKISNVAW